jgi:hypothetical protein
MYLFVTLCLCLQIVVSLADIYTDTFACVYNASGGPFWKVKTNWLQTATICNWYGITCTGNITSVAVDLKSNNLVGLLPDIVACLDSAVPTLRLTSLSLSSNKISSYIPSFERHAFLTKLSLQINSLKGTLEGVNFGPTISSLQIWSNALSGNVPNDVITSHTRLTTFYAYNNFFTGTEQLIDNAKPPVFLSPIFFLSGNLPNFSLPNIQKISFANCFFSGSIPPLPSTLTSLYLYSNLLSGPFPTISDCPDLNTLSLYGNKLSGNIKSFSKSQKLQKLDVFQNQLNGSIPDVMPLFALQVFNVYQNLLQGPIPNFVRKDWNTVSYTSTHVNTRKHTRTHTYTHLHIHTLIYYSG